jgi:phi13 family phage major tail protein
MATIGIATVKLALVDKQGNVKTGSDGIFKYTDQAATDTNGIFTADQDSVFGVASVALSNLTGAGTAIYGSNKLVYTAMGKGAASSVITVNSLPNEIKAAILGQAADGKGGFKISGKSDSNNLVAFLAESAESFAEDKPVYVGMYMGVATEAAITMGTNNASDVRNTDAITVTAQERGDDGFGKFFYSAAKNFDAEAMQKDVFKVKAPAGQ